MENVVSINMKWVASSAWVLLILMLTFIRANIELYKKQKESQSKQERIVKRLQKDINKSFVKAKIRFDRYERLSENYISLKIFNDEGKDLTNCYVITEAISATFTPQPDKEWDELEQINPNNYYISWAGGDEGNGHKTVERKNHAVLNVAKYVTYTKDNQTARGIKFLFHKGDPDRGQMWRPGDYKFKISLRGLIDSKPFQPEEYSFLLAFRVKVYDQNHGETTIDMKEIPNDQEN